MYRKSDKPILVTGGSGYVGSKLVPMLAQHAPVRVLETMSFGNSIAGTPNVEFVQGDIRDRQTVQGALQGVDSVIHLAGIVTDELVNMGVGYSHSVNVEAMKQLCDLAAHAGVERFIYASSSSVYGSQKMECYEGTNPNPQTAYAGMKLAGEYILNQFKERFWAFSVRSATCCGPAPRMRLDTIVNTFCAQAYFKKRITIWGGDQYRSNIHVEDIADLYCKLALVRDPMIRSGYFINAVRGYHTATELALMVQAIIPCEVVIDHEKVDARSYRMASVNGPLMEMRVGWSPDKTIEAAVRDNLAWFQAGNIKDPDSALWHNTRRMADIVKG